MNKEGMRRKIMGLRASGVHCYAQSCCRKVRNICIQFQPLVLPQEDLGEPRGQAPFLRFFQQFPSQERTDGKSLLLSNTESTQRMKQPLLSTQFFVQICTVLHNQIKDTPTFMFHEFKSKFPDNPLVLSFHSLCGVSQGSQLLLR